MKKSQGIKSGTHQTTKLKLIGLSLVFLIGSFFSSCVSGSLGDRLIYTEPDLSCRPLKEIIAQYPDCNPLIDRALNERSEHMILEVLNCYDSTIQLLEESYNICNAPLNK